MSQPDGFGSRVLRSSNGRKPRMIEGLTPWTFHPETHTPMSISIMREQSTSRTTIPGPRGGSVLPELHQLAWCASVGPNPEALHYLERLSLSSPGLGLNREQPQELDHEASAGNSLCLALALTQNFPLEFDGAIRAETCGKSFACFLDTVCWICGYV